MNRLNKFLSVILLLGICSNAYALRIAKPVTLNYPITQDQVISLNRYLEEIFNIQNGRIELDVVTSEKSGANNGEVWLNSSTNQIQFKIGGTVYSAP